MQLLPHTCVLCESRCRLVDLCDACHADLPWLNGGCTVCAVPGPGTVCRRCRQHPPAFSAAFAPLEYRFPVDVLVSRFKHARRLADGEVLAAIMARHAERVLSSIAREATMVTAVPMHWRKQRQRGFNQAALLAGRLARHMHWPLQLAICQRVVPGPDMKQLAAEQRARAIRNVFSVRTLPPGQRVILVDDVITTGETARELSGQLLTAGAEDVVVIAAARTPPGGSNR